MHLRFSVPKRTAGYLELTSAVKLPGHHVLRQLSKSETFAREHQVRQSILPIRCHERYSTLRLCVEYCTTRDHIVRSPISPLCPQLHNFSFHLSLSLYVIHKFCRSSSPIQYSTMATPLASIPSHRSHFSVNNLPNSYLMYMIQTVSLNSICITAHLLHCVA